MAVDTVDAGPAAGALSLINGPAWLGRYVGLPFKSDGLTREGLHCWGLVRLVLSEQAGIEVPSYGEDTADDLLAAARHFRAGAGAAETWTRVETPRLFDVVLMTAMEQVEGVSRRLPAHCGIAVSPSHLLHVWEATASVVMAREHPRVRFRILGFYRHKALL